MMEFQTLHNTSEPLAGRGKADTYAGFPTWALGPVAGARDSIGPPHQFGRMFRAT